MENENYSSGNFYGINKWKKKKKIKRIISKNI